MGFDKVVQKATGAQSLKQLIKLKLHEKREVPWLTPESYLRVSSLATLCAREEVLAAMHKSVRVDEVSPDLALVFAHGTGLHYVLQNEVLAEAGAIVGIWRCVECAKQFGELSENIGVSQSLVPRPNRCECGSQEFLYREQHFINKEFRVGGHPDGFIILPGMPGLGVVECKSVSSRRAWEVKNTPDMGHVIQLQCYLWLTGLKWGKVLYWEKGAFGMSGLFEHTVERDEEAIRAVQDMIRSIWSGIDSGSVPERICSSKECPRAQKCSLAEVCFAE